MELKKIIKEEIDGFDWVKPVQAFYWDSNTNPLKLGDCVIDKLDPSQTNWVIEKLSQTVSGIKTITVSDGEETKQLNGVYFEDDLTRGRYVFCDDFVTENFDWAIEVPNTLSIGEYKQHFVGFRNYFKVGDKIEVQGSINCESIGNEDVCINLSNCTYEVLNVMRSRMKIRPLCEDVLKQFMDEWGQDDIYLGTTDDDNEILISKIEELTENFDWVDTVGPEDYVINKGFYFDPPAYGGDEDYAKLIKYLDSNGFKPEYDTPKTLNNGDEVIGVYVYRGITFTGSKGPLRYVYTNNLEDDDEDYYWHIRGYAESESEDKGTKLEIVDARDYVKTLNPIKENFDWAKDWVNYIPSIGDEFYFDYGMGYDPVLVKIIDVRKFSYKKLDMGDQYQVRFEVMDEDFVQHHTELFYDEEDGWDPTDGMSLESFMNQVTRA